MRYFIVAVMGLFLVGCGYGIKSGDGKKIGQVVKMGQYGMICDTYEGELVRGGFNGGSGVNGTAFHFSVKDEALYKRLLEVMEGQQEIEVTYTKSNFSGLCSGDAGVWVTDFRVLTVPVRPADDKERKRQELLKQLKALE
jgi:hypothetical protein